MSCVPPQYSTAAAIHGSELVTVDGMGHDLPPERFATFVEAIARTADRADRGED